MTDNIDTDNLDLNITSVHKAYLNAKYPYIRVWGAALGSYDYYITNQQEKALLDNAPFTAIYYTGTRRDHSNLGKWNTITSYHPVHDSCGFTLYASGRKAQLLNMHNKAMKLYEYSINLLEEKES